MKQPPEALKDAARVKQAIDSARVYAEEKGVAFTVERLAVCLGVSSRCILDFTMQENPDECYKEAQYLLQMACEENAASLIEHGMAKGNSTTMDVLLLKNNFNYREKSEPAAQRTAVIFFGEEDMPE